MRLGGCSREPELGEALNRGHWPQACSDELRSHVAGCQSCRELAAVREREQREPGVQEELRLQPGPREPGSRAQSPQPERSLVRPERPRSFWPVSLERQSTDIP